MSEPIATATETNAEAVNPHSLVADAIRALRDLGDQRAAGTIGEDEYRAAILPHARVVDEAQNLAMRENAFKTLRGLETLLDLLDARPNLVRNLAAGLAIGLGENGFNLNDWRKGV